MEITVPLNYQPRSYQLPILQAIDGGCRRAVVVWHRRSGKDKTCINIVAKKMLDRVGAYYYVFPTYNQGRKILWDGIDKDGKRFLDHFPKECLEGKPNDTEMKLRYKNGSLFQVVGSDNIDSIVGTNPIGVVFSEYSLQDPGAWGFVRPILAENDGWAIFVFTPRGENHGYDIYNLAQNSPDWFCQILTVNDTKAIPTEILERERREITQQYGNDALYLQEYECNFTVPIAGAYYAQHIMLAYKEGRVGNVPYEDSCLVDTWWDLGVNDQTAIWFTQSIGAELRLIDYYQNTGEGLPHYAGILKERGYVYNIHNAPHDIAVKELGTGRSRWETAKSLGIKFKIIPRLPLEDGINASRSLFRKCWFDAKKCEVGLNALKNYHKEYDDTKKCFVNHPYHDWTSNAADAFRYCALGLNYTKSATNGSYIRNEEAAKQTGWHGGNFMPEWAQPVERTVLR